MNDSDLDNVAPIPNYGHKKEADYRKWSGFKLRVECPDCGTKYPESSKFCTNKDCRAINLDWADNHFGGAKKRE